jgi:predicted transcriptional regulator
MENRYLKRKIVKCAASNKDLWPNLTPEQQAGIERGLQDIDQGKVTSHEDVKKRFGF